MCVPPNLVLLSSQVHCKPKTDKISAEAVSRSKTLRAEAEVISHHLVPLRCQTLELVDLTDSWSAESAQPALASRLVSLVQVPGTSQPSRHKGAS